MFKHSININDIKSVNINAYFLSQLQLNEQTKQIMKLLNKDLIQEYIINVHWLQSIKQCYC